MTNSNLPVIAVVGPTGTGKSDLAISLAQELGGEIVNSDALQFYRGMDIGTAKLPINERGGIAHHLLDTMSIREEASVAAFQAQAREQFAQIRARGKVPVMVGGSGLYVRAALDVIDFPPTDPDARRRLEAEVEAEGDGSLRRRLAEVDPVSAGRNLDLRRAIRALEVYEISGRAFSSFMPQREYFAPAIQIGLNYERQALHAALENRVHKMDSMGLAEEVAGLLEQGLREGKTASRAIGYQQYIDYLDSQITRAEAIEQTVIATRKFARRQITWFNADARVSWLDPTEPDLLEKALKIIG
ncbi:MULTISPECIES: tRNA (adenosine(37)-N6)-dimethylallyltransferase MiaA [Glutamicibacter]|uniref:tRNA dimethylallyltransferase n=2 Tax=Glutamicibacter arilaitensis TaxID=256701 RepID=A0A2N7S5R4_9MICC|nr:MULTISPECIES: tRNA (adenosine(37)-N6)-dimethylallyltransferase MiaA [Glutamicibacter]PMQ21481.1 tRNA (adenosine(37)-N6)-dimethylallyltransferase MiaA [Glutamicibacter arilaitensis]CBT75314.1 tRNA isopentenyltransferase [Glutamicibacter arilaitensis Re117]HCH46448.1 tRNA (adenosine(37)-N6)-dimethylallyltransferase MiaA [Glutamicibacter sp.]HCJ54428.1 tRNA (adenosine(37)-N6)-dimethylallyltransferase MiaA [Glutamicibacter sp.]HCM95570.1 tRNA (adenosine(37)-N6)-dimethylallyltransferase MiaA [Gl